MSDNEHPKLSAMVSQLDELSRKHLTALNKHIVKRIKALDATSLNEAMARVTLGDAVRFTDKQGNSRQAIVMKKNKKTVSLVTLDDDERWNVSPELLNLDLPSNEPTPSNTLTFPKANQADELDKGSAREWIGGTVTLPAFVTGEPGDTFQPTMAVWMNDIGQVIGMEMFSPTGPTYNPVAFLKETIKNPKEGAPGAPTHIRVKDKKLANTLKKAFTTINISVQPTPELDDLSKALLDMPGEAEPQIYSEIARNPQTTTDFFNSTALLYELAPWKVIPHDQCLVGVSVEAFGLKDAVLCVIGQLGESCGIVLFDSLTDYERFTLIGDYIERGEDPKIPPHRALNFDAAKNLSTEYRKDIALHQWTVSDPNAYPNILAIADDLLQRPLTEDDLELFDIISRALSYVLTKVEFSNALVGGPAHIKDFEILTTNRPAIIKLESPYPYERVMQANGAPDNLVAQLLVLERVQHDDDAKDWDKHHELTQALLERYNASPECQSLDTKMGAAQLIVDFTFNYCACTVATLTPLALDDILFTIIPRKVMVGPDDAADIINDTKAFLRFLIREYKLERLDECLAMLNANAIAHLAHALGDKHNFGIGKSTLSSADPFPVLNAPLLKPSATKPPPVDKKIKKKKRAARRKARKKNR